MTKPRICAFTLLELVIALAIAATLAVIAIPSYRSHIARTHRIDASAALYKAAQFVETATGDAPSTLPPGLDQAPQFGAPSTGCGCYRQTTQMEVMRLKPCLANQARCTTTPVALLRSTRRGCAAIETRRAV